MSKSRWVTLNVVTTDSTCVAMARAEEQGAEVGAVGVDRVAAEGDAHVTALGLQRGDLRLPAGLVRQRPLAAGAVDEGQGEVLGAVVGGDGGQRGVAQAGVDVRGEDVRGPGGGRPRGPGAADAEYDAGGGCHADRRRRRRGAGSRGLSAWSAMCEARGTGGFLLSGWADGQAPSRAPLLRLTFRKVS